MSHHQYEEHAYHLAYIISTLQMDRIHACVHRTAMWSLKTMSPPPNPTTSPMPLAAQRQQTYISTYHYCLIKYAVNHEWESWVPFGECPRIKDALMWSTHRLRFCWTVSCHHQHSVALVNLSIQSGNESEGASLWDETWCGEDSLMLWVTMRFVYTHT